MEKRLVRLQSGMHQKLVKLAQHERRSMANMLSVLIQQAYEEMLHKK